MSEIYHMSAHTNALGPTKLSEQLKVFVNQGNSLTFPDIILQYIPAVLNELLLNV